MSENKEFESPSKIRGFFGRSDSFESNEGRSMRSADNRSTSPVRNSLRNWLSANRSRQSVLTQTSNFSVIYNDVDPFPDEEVSEKDFADTSNEEESKYSESVESLLQEYHESPKKGGQPVFHEFFDDSRRDISNKNTSNDTSNLFTSGSNRNTSGESVYFDTTTKSEKPLKQANESSYGTNDTSERIIEERQAYAVHPGSPKLVELPTPNKVHYQDSDINSDNSSISIEPAIYEKKGTKKSGRRPPPEAPVRNSLERKIQHEKMVSGFPQIDSPISSPPFSDYHELVNYNYTYGHDYVPPRYFGWGQWSILMALGLIIPPIYFLLSLGIFDKVKNTKSYYSGIYYKQNMTTSHRAKLIKYSTTQKLISLGIGLFWSVVILAMIGVGFGLSQTR